ncbi:hypothetical protein [Sphingomonas koreensis]|jgi:hypothetical protein|nr:hypothetical protein [Sphingomonas koreensis]MDC7811994.1 hypothetical protein [Sphingomonas koreensis]
MELGWLSFAEELIERIDDRFGRPAAWASAIVLVAAPLTVVVAVLWWAFS